MGNGEVESNDNNPMVGAPVWLRASVLLGAPTMIALGLTWWLTQSADAHLKHIDEVVSPMPAAHVQHDKGVVERFNRLETRSDETIRILLAQCLNDAKTEAARDRCVGR